MEPYEWGDMNAPPHSETCFCDESTLTTGALCERGLNPGYPDYPIVSTTELSHSALPPSYPIVVYRRAIP